MRGRCVHPDGTRTHSASANAVATRTGMVGCGHASSGREVMELFYHATRDIEPPRTSDGARAQPGPRACEACGAELESGGPDEAGTFGLAFCADCRARLDRSAIQIHFCDGCGISLPLYAVERGTALAGDGRILCVRCRQQGTPRRRLMWIVLIVIAAALALGLGVGLAR